MRGVYPCLRLGNSVDDVIKALELYVAKYAHDGCVLPASLKKTLQDTEFDTTRFARMARSTGRLKPS